MRLATHLVFVLAALALSPSSAYAKPPPPPGGGSGEARGLIGVRLGGIIASGTATGGQTAGGGGLYWIFDGTDFFADISGDVFYATNARIFAGGIGAYIPFDIGSSISPYAGGGMKLGYTKFGGGGTFGIIPCISAGAILGRGNMPEIRGELSWFYNAAGEDAASTTGSTSTLTPKSYHASGFIFTVGGSF